ncbi:MAG: GNAT family N-acetyltransferase [Burkholderiaceae bacterium]
MQLDPTPHWRSELLELFVLTPAHVGEAYVAWLNDPAVNRYLESRFARHTQASVQVFVDSMLASADHLFLGIRSLALGGRHVGNIKLGPIDRRHGLGEVGIMLGDTQAWGLGIASAAIAQLALIARDQLQLRKLSAGCYASNQGSARAFVKAGFAVEAQRPQHFLIDGQPEDLVLLGRLL